MSDIFAAVNGNRITEGAIVIPWVGLWSADIKLDKAVSISAPVTLTLGTLSLVGYVFRQADYLGAQVLRIVAGKGGWKNEVDYKGYGSPAGVPLSMVLGDLARDVGEAVSIDTDRSVGDFYNREAGPSQTHLNFLCPCWYILPTGVTKIGNRGSGIIASQFDVLNFNPAFGAVEIGTTEAFGDWTPGRTFSAPTLPGTMTAKAVTHRISKAGVRVEVLT